MIRSVGITRLAAIGATTVMLWLSPAVAAEQMLPSPTVESVVAIAKRLNPTVAVAALDFDAAVHKVGTAGVLKLKVELQMKYAEMERLAGGSL